MTDVTIYHMPEREIHMTGEWVGVCWNTRQEKKQVTDAEGVVYTAKVPVRNGRPYIDFVWIEEDTSGCYEQEDSAVQGGLSWQAAEVIAEELKAAVQYLKAQLGLKEDK